MSLIVTVLGGFYVFAAALALWRLRMEWFAGRAAERLNGKGGEPDLHRMLVILASASLYGAAGLAMILRSGWAVWLLAAALLIQAAYYGAARLWRGSAGQHDPGSRQKAWNAALISTAAFALAAYATRIGILD